MRLDYLKLIVEREEELLALEKKYRSSHLGHRFHFLRLLKSGQCKSVQQAAQVLGYSLRQCQRWLKAYRQQGRKALEQDNSSRRGSSERMTKRAWQVLNEALARDEIASYGQARTLLAQEGVVYKDESSILRLFKRHKIKAKTGRYRHQQAAKEVQEAFKKTSSSGSKASKHRHLSR